jgi:prepilin-type N-terminal cleavage/methylation domain-containing protein
MMEVVIVPLIPVGPPMARLWHGSQPMVEGIKMRKNGFSLIELLISSALLLVLITGTAQLLGLSLTAKRNAEFQFRAARLASSRLERLKSQLFEGDDLKAGVHEESVTDPTSPEICRIAWSVEDLDDSLKKIVLAFSSPTKPRRKAEFCLLLCRELEF